MKTAFGVVVSFLCLTLFLFIYTSLPKVPSGYKGVRVNLLGSSKGVEAETLGVGRYWVGINQELFLFPVFTQNAVWTADSREGSPEDESISFQTSEGMTVSADIGIAYSINPDMVSNIFQKYRKGIEEITDVVVRNVVRDSFIDVTAKMKVEAVYGEGKAELLQKVEDRVKSYFAPIGINIEKVSLIGQFRLPVVVTDAIDAKLAATQKAQQRENELREAEAEAMKVRAKAKGDADAVLIRAETQAKANRIITESITPTLIQYKAVEVWDGILPKVTGGAVPMIDVDNIK